MEITRNNQLRPRTFANKQIEAVYKTISLAKLFAIMTGVLRGQGIPAGQPMVIERLYRPEKVIRFFKKEEPRFVGLAAVNGCVPVCDPSPAPIIDVVLETHHFKVTDNVWWCGEYWLKIGYSSEEESGFEGGRLFYYGPERY